MADQPIETLRRVSVFSRCGEAELKRIAALLEVVDFEAGASLTEQGRPNDVFFIVAEGTLGVSVDGRPRRTIGPGAFFGEISMIAGGPATATVVCAGPVRALVMNHGQFSDAVRGDAEIFNQVMIVMAMHLRYDALEHEVSGSPG